MSDVLSEHLGYVSDARRLDHFRTALAQAVQPGDRVAGVDCGCGVLGLMCLQAGTGHVNAIDSTAAIEMARESFKRGEWGDKSTCNYGSSFQVDLTEWADVVICDHVGYFGFDYGLVELMADARHRFLKPGGRLIPASFRLQLGVVESEACRRLVDGWQAPAVPVEYHWLTQSGSSTKHAVTLHPEEMLAGPALLACIGRRVDNPEFFSWSAELAISQDGIMHGLAGWFECELAEGVWMTNSPLVSLGIGRPQAFLPIDRPQAVKAGDVIRAPIMARSSDNLIAWEVGHAASGAKFSHSTWTGRLLMKEQLRRSHPDYVPRTRSHTARARMLVLGNRYGQRTVRQIKGSHVARTH